MAEVQKTPIELGVELLTDGLLGLSKCNLLPGMADSLGSINTGLANANGSIQEFNDNIKRLANLWHATAIDIELIKQALAQPVPSLPIKPNKPIYLRVKHPPADPQSLGFTPLAMEDDDRRMFRGWNQPGFIQPGPQTKWDATTVAKMCDDHRSWGRDGIIISIEPSNPVKVPDPKMQWVFARSAYFPDTTQFDLTVARCIELVEMVQANGMRAGFYGGLLEHSENYWAPVNRLFYPGNPQTWDRWQANNNALQPITSRLDVLCSSLYDSYDIFERWIYFAHGNIQECLLQNPGKPVIPLVSPSIAGEMSTGPCTSFVRQLQWLKRRPEVTGILIWDMTLPGRPWDDEADWVKEVAA